MRYSIGVDTVGQRFRHWLSALIARYLAGQEEFGPAQEGEAAS